MLGPGLAPPPNRVSGHRDAYATECPGTALYNQPPTLRTWAAGPVAALTVTSVTGASLSGGTYLTKDAVTINWAATTPASPVTKCEVLVDGKRCDPAHRLAIHVRGMGLNGHYAPRSSWLRA